MKHIIISFFKMILIVMIWSILMLSISEADKTKFASNEEDRLKLHLQLYRHHCGNILSCDSDTGQLKSQPNYRIPVPCCLPCPCLGPCSNNHICCPEFGSHNNSASSFESSSRISMFNHFDQHTPMQRIKHTTTKNEEQPIYIERSVLAQHPNRHLNHDNRTEGVQFFKETDKLERTTTGTTVLHPPLTTCIRPQVFNKVNLFIDSQAYMMVKFCFKGNTMVDECDRFYSHTDISEMIPITSRLSGFTYLNRFCFMCNEGDVINENIADVWEAMIVSYAKYYYHMSVLQPNDLMDATVGYSNIHFVPRTRTRAQECEAYDIISCNQTGLWETFDKNVERLCHEGHSLPILHHINYDYNTWRFKNIACVYCNVGDNFNSDTSLTCSYVSLATKNSYSQTLNLRLEDVDKGADESREKQNTSYTERAILPIPNSGVCPPGYTVLLGYCRRVICPRDYYMSNNKCVPFYRSITGVDINVKIEISLNEAIPKRLSSDVLNELRTIINTSLAECVTLQPREITVWYGPKRSKVRDKYFMFDIYLSNSSSTIDFSASVNEIRAFYKNLKTHESISVLNGDAITIEINFNHRLIYKFYKYYDMSISGDGSLRVLVGRTQGDREEPSMLVSNVNWCYRVPFYLFDEAEMIGLDARLIKSASKIVYKDQYDIPIQNLLYLCLDLFKSHIDDDESDISGDDLPRLETNTGDDNTIMALPVPVNVAIISACIGLVVVYVLCKKRYTCIKPTIQSRTQANTDIGIVRDIGMTEHGTQYIEMSGEELDLDATNADNDVSEPNVACGTQASTVRGIVSDEGMTEDGAQYIEMAGEVVDLDATNADNDVSEPTVHSGTQASTDMGIL